MRQFGLRQNISNDPPNLEELHDINIRGKTYIFFSIIIIITGLINEITGMIILFKVKLTMTFCMKFHNTCNGIYIELGDIYRVRGHYPLRL